MDWRAADSLIRGLSVVVIGVLIYDGYHLLRDSQVNRAMSEVEAGEAPELTHPRLRFARAYALQRDGEFEEALKTYAAIEVRHDSRLRAEVLYNLGNLYLRRALEFRNDGADDLALPLVELAKENYRELLRTDSRNWSAKFNLELALRLAPEVELEEVEEERNPEHNPRSAAGIQVRKPLP